MFFEKSYSRPVGNITDNGGGKTRVWRQHSKLNDKKTDRENGGAQLDILKKTPTKKNEEKEMFFQSSISEIRSLLI